MSDTLVAAALGLVIPVLVTSVCGRLWRYGLVMSRGRRRPNDKLLTIGFAVEIAVLAAASYAFKRVASSMQQEAEHFDPYQILDLPLKANATEIKSKYRRLSLKYHPDKNPGNRREAEKKFDQVAKAYKALSDPEARRNWEMYGHPDGYQPWTFDLALPGWLRPGKDTDDATLALYAVGYLAVVVGFIVSVKLGLNALDPVGRGKKAEYKVTDDDVQALLRSLDNTSSTGDVLECLAASPPLCSEERRALAKEMEPTTAPIREWLLSLRNAAAPLRAPHGAKLAKLDAGGNSGRKGKGKGSKKTRGGSSGGVGSGNGNGSGDQGARAPESGPTPEVEGEVFTRGRQGEGNRQEMRMNPERSPLVTHNLVVLLSALHRWGEAGWDSGGGDEGVRADVVGDTTASDPGLKSEQGLEEKEACSGAEGGIEEYQGRDDLARLAGSSGERLLSREQDAVFALAEPLLDACLGVAAKRASLWLFSSVVEAKAMLRRRLWSSEDPAALEKQRVEADVVLDAAVPSIKVKAVKVETWGESQIALGDTVTATVMIVREHASEYRGFLRRRPDAGFLGRGEPWWVIIAGGRGGETLISAMPMLVENLGQEEVECKIKFQAPRRPGIVPLVVYVKSPVFVGVDCESSSSFRVYRHDELKKDEDAGDW